MVEKRERRLRCFSATEKDGGGEFEGHAGHGVTWWGGEKLTGVAVRGGDAAAEPDGVLPWLCSATEKKGSKVARREGQG